MNGANGAMRTHSGVVRALQGLGDSDVIEVPTGFRAHEGTALLPGVLIGKLLGQGAAVRYCTRERALMFSSIGHAQRLS